MKHIDFTQTGGFPLTQDSLDYMQKTYADALNAIAGARSNGPYVLTGCVFSFVTGIAVWRLTPGWMYYNGEIYFVPGGDAPAALTGTQAYGLTVATATTNLTYNDGNVHGALIERTLVFGINADSVSDATHFPMSTVQPFVKDAAAVSMSLGGAFGTTGTLHYRKNWLNNTVHIYGSVTVNNPASLFATAALTGPQYYALGTLPVGYIPAATVPFSMYYRYHTQPILDDVGVDYITTVNAEIDNGGSINAGLIKPAAGVTTYTVSFNTIIPLD